MTSISDKLATLRARYDTGAISSRTYAAEQRAIMKAHEENEVLKLAVTYSVYDGRELAGRVVYADDGHYEARDARDRLVGRFGSAKAAIAALRKPVR